MGRWLLILLVLAGCGGPPRRVTWSDIKTPKPLDGKNLRLEGYPAPPSGAANNNPGEMNFFLLDQPESPSAQGMSVGVVVTAGEKPNQASPLPGSYTIDSLKIHCADGQTATWKDKVAVEGAARVFGDFVSIRASKLEKVP